MRLASAMAMVLGCAVVTAAAQSQPADTAGAAKPSNSAPATITVTGCLERARQAETPTTGVVGARTTAPATFVLINAASSNTVQASGGGVTYILDGNASLASRIGHRVEVKGTTIAPPSGSAPDVTAPAPPQEPHESGAVTGGTPGQPGTSAPSAANQHLRVMSVRSVGDCSSSR